MIKWLVERLCEQYTLDNYLSLFEYIKENNIILKKHILRGEKNTQILTG